MDIGLESLFPITLGSMESMYGICTYMFTWMWPFFTVHVGKYSIHGSYGYWKWEYALPNYYVSQFMRGQFKSWQRSTFWASKSRFVVGVWANLATSFCLGSCYQKNVKEWWYIVTKPWPTTSSKTPKNKAHFFSCSDVTRWNSKKGSKKRHITRSCFWLPFSSKDLQKSASISLGMAKLCWFTQMFCSTFNLTFYR